MSTQCDKCEKIFKTVGGLRCHLNLIHGVRTIHSCTCGKIYKNWKDLEQHKKTCVRHQPQQPVVQQTIVQQPVQIVYNATYISNTQNNTQVNISPELCLKPMTFDTIVQYMIEFVDNLIHNNIDIKDSESFAMYWHQSKFKHTILATDLSRCIATWIRGGSQIQSVIDKHALQYMQAIKEATELSSELREKINVYVRMKTDQAQYYERIHDFSSAAYKYASIRYIKFWQNIDISNRTGKSIVKASHHVKSKLALTDSCKLKWFEDKLCSMIELHPMELLLVSHTSIGMLMRQIVNEKDPNATLNLNNQMMSLVNDQNVQVQHHISTFVQMLKQVLTNKLDSIKVKIEFALEEEQYVHKVIRAASRTTSVILAREQSANLIEWLENNMSDEEVQQYEGQIMVGLLMSND